MVDAEEAAARERDVPRRLLGEHRGGPPGSRAPQAALCAARSPLALEPGLHRPAGPSVAVARGLSRRSWGLCAEAAILAGGGAEPARAGLSGGAGNGRAPGSEAPPPRGPALPGSPPGPGDPAPSPGPETEAPPAVQPPGLRSAAPAAPPKTVARPGRESTSPTSCCLPRPHHRGRRKGADGGPEEWGWPLSGPGRRHLSWTPGSGGPCCPGSISPPSGVGLRPPGTPRSSPRARDLKDPPRLIHRITRKHTGLHANHNSQREHWRLRPTPDLPAELRPPRSQLYLGTKLVSIGLLSQLLRLWCLLRGDSSPDPP